MGSQWQDMALAAAGIIGVVTAIIHGVVMQRTIVRPLAAVLAENSALRGPARRLVVPLLHVSTLAWLLGGVTLMVAAAWIDGVPRQAIAGLVAILYLHATICNAWATRGRHPGWMLMAAAVILILAAILET